LDCSFSVLSHTLIFLFLPLRYVISPARYTTRIPEGVSDLHAGPIMCSGATIWSALKKANLKAGDWVVIPGAGGGVGHFGVQYAKAMGCRVVAIDSGKDKDEMCKKLGAEVFLDFKVGWLFASFVRNWTVTDGLVSVILGDQGHGC
jgi:D-arabinose 1-dehydrogenase-like Zn-dependent alcohol dehydrogenase